ncbi:hypothetical protein Hanom_Chr03g00215501 [Helianthus anomalus]
MEDLMAQFKAYTEVTAQKVQTKQREVDERVQLKQEAVELMEWEIMTADINSYPKEDRLILRKMKEKMAKIGILKIFNFYQSSIFLSY